MSSNLITAVINFHRGNRARAAHWSHKPESAGSTPAPATNSIKVLTSLATKTDMRVRMKDEGGNDEGVVTLIESFNQHHHAVILHPSAFILALVSPACVALRAF
jgi:hypothetical protein